MAFVSKAVTVPRNGVAEGVAGFLTTGFVAGAVAVAGGVVAGGGATTGGGTGVTGGGATGGGLALACARDDAGKARNAAAHKVNRENFAICFFMSFAVEGF